MAKRRTYKRDRRGRFASTSSVDSPRAMPNVTIWKRCDAAGFKLRVDSAPIEAAAN
jgi:hypothetical protein